MTGMHGGDIYRNKVRYDFSVNINPLGMPEAVKAALERAVLHSGDYPDIRAYELRKAVAGMLSVKEEYLLFGNGASELFMAIVHALKPQKIIIPVPSFYGYEHAAKAAGSEIKYFLLMEEEGFRMPDRFLDELTEDTGVVFLANPNNPTGVLMDRNFLIRLLQFCKERGIWVVLDECFVDFCGRCPKIGNDCKENSLISELENFDNLMIVSAFTKIFAIPGVRLGFLLCSNRKLGENIAAHLPEWNLSIFAQEAGMVCAGQKKFIEQTRSYVEIEKNYLTSELIKMGFTVYLTEANFILFKINKPVCVHSTLSLKEALLEKGILIRDCSNFRGLSEGFYRIAVKQREENEILLKAMRELI